MRFRILDHIDAQPFIDPVRRPGTAPRHVEGHVAAPAGRCVPVKSLHAAISVARDDQLDTRVTAFERVVENHRKSAFDMRSAVRGVEHLRQLVRPMRSSSSCSPITSVVIPALWVRCTAWRRLRYFRPTMVNRRNIDDHVASDRYRSQRLAGHGRRLATARASCSPQPSTMIRQPRLRHIVAKSLASCWKCVRCADGITADDRETQPRAIGDRGSRHGR